MARVDVIDLAGLEGNIVPVIVGRMTGTRSKESIWRFAELFGLCGLAIAWPACLYIQNSYNWIITIQADWTNIIASTVLFLLAPAITLWLIETVCSLVAPDPVVRWLHATFIGVLVALLANAWLKSVPLPVPFRLLLACCAFAFALIARNRWAPMRMWLRLLSIAPLLLAAGFLASPAINSLATARLGRAIVQHGKPATERVVFMVFDELPLSSLLSDQSTIDPSLFPAFADLADHSTWYRNSASNADYTLRAFPALISGRMPDEDKAPAPTAHNFPENVFTLLASQYKMNVHEAHETLCPDAVCASRNPYPTSVGFEALVRIGFRAAQAKLSVVSDASPSIGDLIAPPSMLSAERFVSSLKPSTQPVFDYAHIMLPHQPWDYVGPGSIVTTHIQPLYSKWPTAEAAESGKQQHLLTLQAADALLGRVVARLKAINAYQKTLLIVTADHGIAFMTGEEARKATETNYPSVVWTPLLIKAPKQVTNVIDDRPVETIDLLPTILDYTGISSQTKLPGRSVRLTSPEGSRSTVRVATSSAGGPGTTITFDRAAGFAKTLSTSGWPGIVGDPDRLYRIGPYAGLVGKAVTSGRNGPSGTLRPKILLGIDPMSKNQPWLNLQGRVSDLMTTDVAVTVNGRVAGLGLVSIAPSTSRRRVNVALIPESFVNGRNILRVFSVSGDPTAPTFREINLSE